MELQSKYDAGQEVWSIVQQRKTQWQPCAFCDGQGKIWGADGTERRCPVCNDRKGRDIYLNLEWQPYMPLTIGQIRLVYTGQPEEGQEQFEEWYMCNETGVGSGTNWTADALYPSHEAAVNECDARNEVEAIKE